MEKKTHEGKVLAQFLKGNGYTMTRLSKKLRISRTTFYSKLKLKKLPYEFITSITNATSHQLLPFILKGKIPLKKQKAKDRKKIIHSYIATLEKHIELLEITTTLLSKHKHKSKAHQKLSHMLSTLKNRGSQSTCASPKAQRSNGLRQT